MAKKFFLLLIPLLISCSLCSFQVNAATRLQQWKNEIPVIVIDPGHGGDNEGTTENNHLEKDMTLLTALSMYEELSKYDELKVYLTRSDDVDMSLKERARFASDVNADFLISLHYNASVEHDLFGAEVWIPYEYPFNNYSYQLAYEFLKTLQDNGIFIRGIKTKLNDKGLDYYGIIREANAKEIPAVILEHCHVDEARDEAFCVSEEDCILFGKQDAAAVLRYIGIDSDLCNVSEYYPVTSTYADVTAPDICTIVLKGEDLENGILSFEVSATDYDSCLIYYDYSIDGGNTFSKLNPWPESDALKGIFCDTFTLNLSIPSGTRPEVIIRAYNLFDLQTESNTYISPYIFHYGEESSVDNSATDETAAMEYDNILLEQVPSASQNAVKEVKFWIFFAFCIVIAIGILLLTFTSQIGVYFKRRKRRLGKNKKQHK